MLRREAALDQVIHIITHWGRPATQQAVMQLLDTVGTRLQTLQLDIGELKTRAVAQEMMEVLAKLAGIYCAE